MKRLASLLASLALSLTASAQEVTLYGDVEDVQGTVNQFFLDCTSIQLQSAAIQLATFQGQYVKLRGNNIGTAAAPRIEVTAIEPFAQVTNLGGDRRPGTRFEIDLFLPAGTPYALYLGVGEGFVPLGSFGTWYLGANSLLYATGMTAGPITTIFAPIPNQPQLVGLDLRVQTIYLPSGGEPIASNVDCKAVRA
ncbi:MAG: hypothetical protein IPN34_24205 [Planctomycetes bacterium]|nr:hypothetical protein [Planctomycetota bacterium]